MPPQGVRLLATLFLTEVKAQCSVTNENCVSIDEWQFSLALGVGVISNPLHEGKNVPLVIIPSFSFYGNNWFFDKNTLGYSFYQSSSLVISGISQPNRENTFFMKFFLYIPYIFADCLRIFPLMGAVT